MSRISESKYIDEHINHNTRVQEIESIWSGCVKAVQLILDDDLPEDVSV